MATPLEDARAADRDRALRAVSSWTWAAGLGGIGLTAAIAVLAAGTFSGHQAAAAAPPAVSVDPGNPDNSVTTQPQPLPPDSFGGSNQPPAAVSGGS
ncbi:MAG TPA: hypothetical protein VGD57_07855 [Candidatus Dormibacteraeota bacterium]|jgi:hypothetical protein